jgi:hypothetical protein
MRVVTIRQMAGIAIIAGVVVGCGGEEPAPIQTPMRTAPPHLGQQVQVEDTVSVADETQLLREVFSYRGSGRDPFASLLESGDVRPLIQDLRITSITYDPRYPAASIAILRDTIVNQAYPVRVGDEIGRMRVVEIAPGQVVLVISEFGSERQVVLRQRRRQEGTP